MFGEGAWAGQVREDAVREFAGDAQRLRRHGRDQQRHGRFGTRHHARQGGGGGQQLSVEVGAARFDELAQGGEELPEQPDGALVRDAETGLRQVLGAEREPEVVVAAGRRLGGLGLTGDEERMAAEDGDRGGPDVQPGYLAADDRGQRG